MGVRHALQQRHHDLASLARICKGEAAFAYTLTDNPGEQWRALGEHRLVHFQADDRVVVAIPDPQERNDIGLVGGSQTIQRIEEALKFVDRRTLRIMDNWQEWLFKFMLDSLD